MTLFIGDFSHYDGRIDLATAQRLRAEGLVSATHKLGEGLGGEDDMAAGALAAFRDAGFDLIGCYGVPRSGDGAAEARTLIALADKDCPWWRDMPGWFWQVDLERWPYDSVSPQDGREYADELAKTGKRVVVYASKGQYGDDLRGWPYPLWNANYPSSRQAGYRSLYPGDSGVGWATYSGQTPAFWQYASSATIGGLTTCDISAYRGTLDQLRALLTNGGSTMALTDPVPGTGTPDKHPNDRSQGEVLHDVWWSLGAAGSTDWPSETLRNSRAILAALAASQKREEATLAAITALASGGTSVDTAAILAHIDQVAAGESAAVTALHEQVAALQSKLAAAAQAEAGALAQ